MEKRKDFKVFIACFRTTLTKNDIHSVFSKYSSLKQIDLPTRKNGGNKSIAIIYFEEESEYLDLIRRKYVTIEGRKVKVHPYLTGEELEAHRKDVCNRRIFLDEIPEGFTETQLKELLSQFGTLQEIYIIKNNKNPKFTKKKNNKNNFYGYAEFKFENEALNAIEKKYVRISDNEKIRITKYKDKQKRRKINEKQSTNKKMDNWKSLGNNLKTFPNKNLMLFDNIIDNDDHIHKPTKKRHHLIRSKIKQKLKIFVAPKNYVFNSHSMIILNFENNRIKREYVEAIWNIGSK